jgi:DNA-binding NarL/FixJ family response regulator
MPVERSAVLLDHQPMWLDALERVLVSLEIVPLAKLTNPAEALTAVTEHQPELFILDTDTNGSVPDGVTCLREAMGRVPSLKAVVISASNEAERIDAALGAGAMAYVLKHAQPEDVAAAIRQIFSRSLYFADGQEAPHPGPSVESDNAGLTRREREILEYVAEGSTNGDVARTLWVTEQTVKFHLANIFRKLDVTNRTQASRWAHTHGLLRTRREEDIQPAPAA